MIMMPSFADADSGDVGSASRGVLNVGVLIVRGASVTEGIEAGLDAGTEFATELLTIEYPALNIFRNRLLVVWKGF